MAWGALCSQHFEYGSNYGHVFPVSRPLPPMRFSMSRTRSLIRTRRNCVYGLASEVARGVMVRSRGGGTGGPRR